jgi:hypothetical protein
LFATQAIYNIGGIGHALAMASQSILLTTLIVISPVSIKLPRSHCSNAAQQPMAQTNNLLQAFIFGFKTRSHQTFLDNILENAS